MPFNHLVHSLRQTSRWTVALIIALAAAPAHAQNAGASVSGRVVEPGGAPIAGARVFVEQGVSGSLLEGTTGAGGAYRIDNIEPGTVGVFAHAPGRAFGGKTVTLSVGQAMTSVDLSLGNARSLSGKIIDTAEEPVANARITGAALIHGGAAVGIPLGKLNSYGYPVPRSNAEGAFTVSNMPQGVRVDVKIAHGAYAQLTQPDLGASPEPVILYPGVIVEGNVLSRGSRLAVPDALLVIQGGDGSALTRTESDGTFSIRLNPGKYKTRAEGASFESGWQEFVVGEQSFSQRVTLYVMGKGILRGDVRDAVTEQPIPQAQLNVAFAGNPTQRLYTGPSGEFAFSVPAGENTVTLATAPGYMAPATPTLTVTVAENETFTLPTYWLAPLPAYSITVIGPDERPVPNAIVTVLRPPQLGWYTTGAAGNATLAIANLPNDGTVVGTVSDATGALGALFALKRGESEDALVQLTPTGAVRGHVVDGTGKGLPGAVVDARYVDDAMPESIPLWRTVSGPDGLFAWPHALPFVPQVCGATVAGAGGTGAMRSEEVSYLLQAQGVTDVGQLVAQNGTGWISFAGKTLPIASARRICGPELASGRPTLVIVADSGAVLPWAETLARLHEVAPGLSLQLAIVTDEETACPSDDVTVLVGDFSGPATTYVVNAGGIVALETFGLPPVSVLREVGVSHGR